MSFWGLSIWGWIVVILIVGFILQFLVTNQLCPARHARLGKCMLKPNHWPRPHANARGETWR